VKNMEDTVQYG